MKNLILATLLFLGGYSVFAQDIYVKKVTTVGVVDNIELVKLSDETIGIGISTPDASSILDLTSTTTGFLVPRMTTAQRNAITSPATGLKVFNTTTNTPNYYNGTAWVDLSNPILTRRYNVFNRARVGTGGGAASSGQIQDVPVIIFNATQDQEAFFTHHINPEVDLSATNPSFEIHFALAGAAGVGTETIRLQLQIRYRADGEGFDGAYDETLIQDIDVTTGTAYMHGHESITLDRTKMAVDDAFSVRILRVGTHGNDDYNDNWGISQIFLVYSGTGGQ